MDGGNNPGNMKALLFLAVFLLLIPPAASAVRFEVSVSPVVAGRLGFMKAVNGPVQRFHLEWSNTGSVGCRSRSRIDFYRLLNGPANQSSGTGAMEYARSVYGPEVSLMAGDSASWDMYNLLKEGEYAAVPVVRMCNQEFVLEGYEFSAGNLTAGEGTLRVVNAVPVEGGVDVYVTSSRDIDEVVLFSDGHPRGWVFESAIAENIRAGETRLMRLGCESVGYGREVSLTLVSGDGSEIARHAFEFSEPAPEACGCPETALLAAAALAALAAVLLVREYRMRPCGKKGK